MPCQSDKNPNTDNRKQPKNRREKQDRMMKVSQKIMTFFRDENGISATEYAVLGVIIALGIAVILSVFGGRGR
jgi:Flp pilus assembly pilin Flp